jgi:hypothetical protein
MKTLQEVTEKPEKLNLNFLSLPCLSRNLLLRFLCYLLLIVLLRANSTRHAPRR